MTELCHLILENFSEIRELNLDHNNLTTKGLKEILRKFQKMQIRGISFEGNHFEIRALDYLVSFSKYNKSLRYFKIGAIHQDFHNRMFAKRLKILQKHNIHVHYSLRSG